MPGWSRRSSWSRWCIARLTVVLAMTGCAGPVYDPGGFVVLNGTGHVLTTLSVAEVSDDPLAPQRIGRFENVPPNTVQYVRRSEDAPPMPEELEIIWQPRDGKRNEQIVALRHALDGAGPVGRESVVVLEIGPDGTVSVAVTDE